MKNKKIIYLIVLTLLIMTISGCKLNKDNLDIDSENNKDQQIAETKAELGGEIILPLTNFNTLNPLITENDSYYFFSKLIFESLFEFDDNLNMEGQLVKDYSVSDNGRKIEIRLRDDIFWHDSKPLTSEDVAFTVNTIKYANTDSTYNKMFIQALGSFSPSDIRRIVDVNVVDQKNLIVTFDRSFSNNLEVLTFPIIPKHVFVNGEVDNNAYINALQSENYIPIGTGPFKFSEYEKMKQITLVANEEYREKRPYIDKILGKVFDTEEDILRAFETGQINMATTIGVDWEKYNQNNGINSIEFISPNYEFLGFNFNKKIFQGEDGKILRKAIVYGINRQKIIETLYLGHGTQIDVPIHPKSWLISDASNSYGYSLDMAKKKMNKLKAKDIDVDKISIDLLTNTFNPVRLKTAEMIKENLSQLGIEVNIFPQVERKDEISEEDIKKQWEEVNKMMASGKFDVVLSGWKLSVIPDLSFAFHSSQIKYNTNFVNYSNQEMDTLLEKVYLNGNREDKQGNYKELQDLISEDLPYISLFFKNKSLLLNNKIKGNLQPTFFNPYKGIKSVYIPKDLQ